MSAEITVTASGNVYFFAVDNGGNRPVNAQTFRVDLTGALTLTLGPAEAVAQGAQWRLAGESGWHGSGATVSNIPPGRVQVEFRTLAAWLEPATTNVLITRGDLARPETFVYQPASGALRVDIAPPAAVAAGALWSVDGTSWHGPGVEVPLPVGHYVVQFKPLFGWAAYPAVDVDVAKQTTTVVPAEFFQLSRPLRTTFNRPSMPRWREVSSGSRKVAMSGLAVDLSGAPRPLHGDGDSVAGYDRGAFEFIPPAGDTDGDGLNDGWEIAHELNPLQAGDADQDADADGLTNREEFSYNTDPWRQDTDGDGTGDEAEVQQGRDPVATGLEWTSAGVPGLVTSQISAAGLGAASSTIAMEQGGKLLCLVSDSNGVVHMAYGLSDAAGNYRLTYITYEPDSGVSRTELVRIGPGRMVDLSLDLTADEQPCLLYGAAVSEAGCEIKYAFRRESGWTVQDVEQGASLLPVLAMKVDASAVAHVVYARSGLEAGCGVRYGRWDRELRRWTLSEDVPAPGGQSDIDIKRLAIDLDSQGVLCLAWASATNPENAILVYARRMPAGWSPSVVEGSAGVGPHLAFDLGPEGTPHLAFYDYAHGRLMSSGHGGSLRREMDGRGQPDCGNDQCHLVRPSDRAAGFLSFEED